MPAARLLVAVLSQARDGATGFWAWTGRHDAAVACRMALEQQQWEGHEVFFINGGDTTLTMPTTAAIESEFPGTRWLTCLLARARCISLKLYPVDLLGIPHI